MKPQAQAAVTRTIRRHELREIVPLADTTIYDMEQRGEFPIKWAEKLSRQCATYEVPFFFKQDSGLKSGERGRAPAELWSKKEFPNFRK